VKALGENDPAVAETLNSYSSVLRATNRNQEAAQIEARVNAILASRKAK
jgi:hypothetical protein